jgi:hypothetical protein
MLSDPKIAHIVSWNDTGETFIVKDEGKFAKDVLSNHFRHQNFASFVRSVWFVLFVEWWMRACGV